CARASSLSFDSHLDVW
nr:immunoglobulin heavy chain junction region [Macaca mulatta]